MLYLDKNNKKTNEEYKLEINENNEKVIKTYNEQYKKEVNIIFDIEESNVMPDIIKQLSKYFVEDVINIEEIKNKKKQ